MINGVNINDVFAEMGRFRMVKRTTGVSTTDLTGKLLRLVSSESEEESKESNGPNSDHGHIVQPPKQSFL